MSAPTLGLRERKKEATRLALHQAAVRIAAEHGLARLTVEAIADAAVVSRRTFSNYFTNKEEALLYSDQLRMRRLLEGVSARPRAESAWAALSAAAIEVVSQDRRDPRWVAEVRLLRRQPSLLAQLVRTYADGERALAEAVVDRLPAGNDRNLRARLLAAALLTALRIAVQQWIENPGRALSDVLVRVLDVAAEPWS